MSSTEVVDAVGGLDLRTAEEVLNGSAKDAVDPEQDLGKVLPKLSKRISQSGTLNKESDGGEDDQRAKRQSEDQTPLDFSAVDVALQDETTHAEDQRMPSRVKAQTRVSGSHTSGTPGSITVMVRPSSGLSPELERLRLQDINPDENSAAFLAITGHGAGSGGSNSGPTPGTDSEAESTPAKRRMSLSRQLSGRYQKTSRKVEGREIQQDHSQYMLTYALMLGIRVMTGRRDPELDKRQSMSRKGKSGSSEDLQATATGSVSESSADSSPHPVVSPTTVAAPPTAGSAPTTGASTTTTTNGFRRPLSFAFSSHGGTFGTGGSSGMESGPSSLGFGLPSISQRDWESASARQMLVERELSITDFDEALELKFKPQGSTDGPMPTPPHKLNFSFKFKDYMPAVFRAVRGMSNIDEADYMLSLAGDFNYIEVIANSKSGQFFFYSHDGCYMIKTQTKDECVLLRDIMPKYVAHLTNHPNSLLVRFYGMHRVKFKTSKIYFVIMSSVFNTEKPIDIKFDLKGSLAGRRTSDKACKQGAVQKDLNLMESGRKFRLGENAELFHDTLKADVELLASLKIMDYSLLVGIHDKKAVALTPGSAQRRSSGVVLSQSQRASVLSHAAAGAALSDVASVAATEGTADFKDAPTVFQSYYGGIPSAQGVDEIYFMGIIDILQRYNLSKQTETFYKGIFADKMLQSSVPPDLYASRMLEFIMKHTDYAEVVAQRGGKANSGTATASAQDSSSASDSGAAVAGPAPGSEEAKAARRDLL